MDDGKSFAGEVFSHVGHDIIIILVSPPKKLTRLLVLDRSLLRFYTAPGVTMARVETKLLAVAFQTDRIRIE